MSNSLDPDQVGPDLGTSCLPRLSADDTGRQRVITVPIVGNAVNLASQLQYMSKPQLSTKLSYISMAAR